MNTLNRIKSLARNAELRSAYSRWLLSKATLRGTPILNLAENTRLGGWLNFSEYWTFREAVSNSELLFMRNRLSGQAGLHTIAFDVGANIGAFTCLPASLGVRTVHSFEPIPETFCRLKANARLNGFLGRCSLNCVAVGKEPGLVTFRVQDDSPATNRLALPQHGAGAEVHESLQRVAVVNLDAYCFETGVKSIDLLKVDVEGMEPFVLRGARTLFKERRIAAVLIEICPVNLRSVGLSPGELYHEFETIRYSPYALNDKGEPAAKLSLANLEAMSLVNAVLLPDV